MEQILSLITLKLKTIAEVEDHPQLQSKRKAISALLPYAVWQERDGQPEMLDTILRASRASGMLRFIWHRVSGFVSILLSEASPRAIALALPHIPWHQLADRGDLIQQWAASAAVVPYTREVAQGVVDTLLQIASEGELVSYIPIDLWSWLTRCPTLPPICRGRYVGTRARIVDAVRALKDVEVLKSYLLVVWSEWDDLWFDGLHKMHTSIREDFGRIGMGHHRADLIQRLDHVLGQLDRGLEYFKRHDAGFGEDDLRIRIDRYRKLRKTSLETNARAIYRTPRFTVMHPCVLTSSPAQNPVRRLCAHSLFYFYSPTTETPSPLTPYFVRTSALMPSDAILIIPLALFSFSPSRLMHC